MKQGSGASDCPTLGFSSEEAEVNTSRSFGLSATSEFERVKFIRIVPPTKKFLEFLEIFPLRNQSFYPGSGGL